MSVNYTPQNATEENIAAPRPRLHPLDSRHASAGFLMLKGFIVSGVEFARTSCVIARAQD